MNTAIIGGGKISEQHLSSLMTIKETKVSAICDLSQILASFTADRFAIPQCFTDHRKMLNESEADVVHILTPPASHDRLIRDCLTAGKHVIIEKPIALSYAGFCELAELANQLGLRLIENHNYRFNEPIVQLEKAIANGKIGQVEEVEVRIALNIRGGGRYADENLPHPSHSLPAGIIHEFITHLTYLLLHFLPDGYHSNIDSVRARWNNHGGGDLFKYDDLDVNILAGITHGRLRFSCRQFPDCFSVQIRGSDGMATADLFNPICNVTSRRAVGQHLTPLANALSEAKTLTGSGFAGIWGKIRNRGAYEGLSRFLELTYDALSTGKEPPVTYRQMDATSRLVDMLLTEENRL